MRNMFVFSLMLFAVFLVCTPEVHGVKYYSLSYSYFDEIAQAYCACQRKGWTFAIRRNCSKPKPSCKQVCEMAKEGILHEIDNEVAGVACLDALYVKKDHPRLCANPSSPQTDPNKVGMSTYGYGKKGCEIILNNKRRPNYCCCRAYDVKPIKKINRRNKQIKKANRNPGKA